MHEVLDLERRTTVREIGQTLRTPVRMRCCSEDGGRCVGAHRSGSSLLLIGRADFFLRGRCHFHPREGPGATEQQPRGLSRSPRILLAWANSRSVRESTARLPSHRDPQSDALKQRRRIFPLQYPRKITRPNTQKATRTMQNRETIITQQTCARNGAASVLTLHVLHVALNARNAGRLSTCIWASSLSLFFMALYLLACGASLVYGPKSRWTFAVDAIGIPFGAFLQMASKPPEWFASLGALNREPTCLLDASPLAEWVFACGEVMSFGAGVRLLLVGWERTSGASRSFVWGAAIGIVLFSLVGAGVLDWSARQIVAV